MKRILLKIGCLVGVVLVLFLGWQFYDNKCVKRDPAYYEFYYSVVGENGGLVPEGNGYDNVTSPIGARVTKRTFTAMPDEGYQVKEWTFNSKVVEGNTSNTYTAVIEDYNVRQHYVTVEFELIDIG